MQVANQCANLPSLANTHAAKHWSSVTFKHQWCQHLSGQVLNEVLKEVDSIDLGNLLLKIWFKWCHSMIDHLERTIHILPYSHAAKEHQTHTLCFQRSAPSCQHNTPLLPCNFGTCIPSSCVLFHPFPRSFATSWYSRKLAASRDVVMGNIENNDTLKVAAVNRFIGCSHTRLYWRLLGIIWIHNAPYRGIGYSLTNENGTSQSA